MEVTGGLPVLPVAGTRPAIFPPLFFAPSLLALFIRLITVEMAHSRRIYNVSWISPESGSGSIYKIQEVQSKVRVHDSFGELGI